MLQIPYSCLEVIREVRQGHPGEGVPDEQRDWRTHARLCDDGNGDAGHGMPRRGAGEAAAISKATEARR
jgi:hypothetical protein